MFKKILSLCLALVMVVGLTFTLASCNGDDEFKLGVILLHDEASTYDKNFIEAVNRAKANLGLDDSQVILKRNIPESSLCTEAAEDLVDQGCDVIFANSFGHEEFLLAAARKHPDVQFCHATGTMAHTAGVANFHNAFASIYEGRFLAGVAAGLKINEMVAADASKANNGTVKIGYVGAFTYAEVISGYTSYYLGVKYACDYDVQMDVKFTGSWYDEVAERTAAQDLISGGCILISQHADSMGAPGACETAGVPNVSYNGSTVANCPNTFIISSKIDWTPYFEYICNSVMEGKTIAADWTGTIATGSVALTDINTAVAAEGTQAEINRVKNLLTSGELEVFDLDTFTVGGNKLSAEHKADVDTDADYTPDTKVVENDAFKESKFRSAPYFDLRIDGITLLNEKY